MAATYSMGKPMGSYLPSTPVKVPKPIVEYSQHLETAPLIALGGITADGRHLLPRRFEVTKRNRERITAGSTNRWRIPQSLLSDLLGTSQAKRAISLDYIPSNISLVKIYTAESPLLSVNADRLYDETPRSSRRNSLYNSSPDCGLRTPSFNRAPQSAPPMSPRKKVTRKDLGAQSPIKKFVPHNARPATVTDLFYYHSKQNPAHSGAPDVLLKCLGVDWELHSPVIKKSTLLSNEFSRNPDGAEVTDYYKNSINARLDSYVTGNKIFSNQFPPTTAEGRSREFKGSNQFMDDQWSQTRLDDRGSKKDKSHPAHVSTVKKGNVTVITLDINDRLVTSEGLAVALGNLYHERPQVTVTEAASVLAAARALEFFTLEEHCVEVMAKGISAENLNTYYQAARKYGKRKVVDVCERWLELHLVPDLSMRIQLRNVPLDLLQTVVRSSRLFTFNEYALFKVICHWLFLQLNPQMQLLPSHTTVLSYFNSLPKQSALLERAEGQDFVNVFEPLRLHGVIDTAQFQDLRSMNILPNNKVVAVLAEHYQSLQAGGDMGLLRTFAGHAIRHGFILDVDLPYHSEILSLHGFHFELKAVKTGNTYAFFMTRLKPTDPVLSFRQCERHTFSMRPDRDVKYSITVQTMADGEQKVYSTGQLMQRFTLNGKNSKSQSLVVDALGLPLHTTFAVVFPQS